MNLNQCQRMCDMLNESKIRPAVPQIPDSYMLLSCGQCGHEADFLEFCQTPITGDLPKGTHQCPSCRKAWRMEVVEPGRWIGSDYFIPAKRKAVQIPTIL